MPFLITFFVFSKLRTYIGTHPEPYRDQSLNFFEGVLKKKINKKYHRITEKLEPEGMKLLGLKSKELFVLEI